MKTWHIRAHGAYEAIAREPPESLDAAVRASMGKPPRRINRYIRLALIGAHRCVANLQQPLPATTPLFMASEHGNVAEAVALMDEIVVRCRSPMPMPFINVSSNMVGYYLAASLGLNGRNMNVARDRGAFGAMLELAGLEAAAAPTQAGMLLGTVAENVWPLAEHRRRCELPADTPLVEASYWLVVDDGDVGGCGDKHAPRLSYAKTTDQNEARAWLAAGERWAIDPHLPDEQLQALSTGLQTDRAWQAPLCHRGHADAIVHALFAALRTQPVSRLHVAVSEASGGYQLMAVG